MNLLLESIKKRPINIILMGSVTVLYFVNTIWLKNVTPVDIRPFFICYFNDLIAPLFFLAYCNMFILTRGREVKRLVSLLLICLGCGLVWEFFAPFIKATATVDPVDFLCYEVGGLLYWLVLKYASKAEGIY